jgi:mono/diheme cytochrome c family protein
MARLRFDPPIANARFRLFPGFVPEAGDGPAPRAAAPVFLVENVLRARQERVMRTASALAWVIVAISGVTAARVDAQTSEPSPKRASEDGATLYKTYCADCHGKDGKTRGPVASRQNLSVPDLKLLTSRNQGVFPLARVEKLLTGTERSPIVHGGIQMPLWGQILAGDGADPSLRESRAHALARYLESLQK